MCESCSEPSFGRPGHDDFPAGMPAFRPEIDDVIGRLDDVQVMLDQQDGVPGRPDG